MQRFLISLAATMILTVATGTCWAALPDLVIDQVVNDDTAAGHHSPTMHVTVKNQGTAPSSGCWMKWRVIYRDQEVNRGTLRVPPLVAGAISPPLVVGTTPHVHPRTVWLKVDVNNQVMEANEANNVRVVPIP